eukprot:6074837-Prorocentrum_lima.AAC.1
MVGNTFSSIARLVQALQALGLSHGYRWYSLRRGGATYLLASTADTARLIARAKALRPDLTLP